MPQYTAESLILLKDLEATTNKCLAENARISQSTMGKMINRQREVSERTVESLSSSMDYPMAFFEHSINAVPVVELTYRHTSKSSVSELNAVATEYSMLQETVKKLENSIGISPDLEWMDALAPRTEKISQDDIERLASKTREYLGLNPSGRIGNLTRCMERKAIVIAPLRTLTSLGGAEHLHSDGVTYPGMTDSAAVIGYAPDSSKGDRERFTKAHELGHLILHRYRRPNQYKDMEREAHAFAGAILMPQDDVRLLISPETMLSQLVQLKSTWGMSIASLISRAYQSGIFSKDKWRSMYMQLSARGWRKNEPVHVGSEKPILLNSLIKRQYSDDKGLVDSFALEEGLGVPFRYADVWSTGLQEQGSDLGFTVRRF